MTTVFAADAVARLRQSIGVAAVTAGTVMRDTVAIDYLREAMFKKNVKTYMMCPMVNF